MFLMTNLGFGVCDWKLEFPFQEIAKYESNGNFQA